MSDNTWDVLSPEQVATATGISRRTVLDLLNSGELKGTKRGGRWYVRSAWVEEFFTPTNQHRAGGGVRLVPDTA